MTQWRRQRRIQKDPDSSTSDLAFSTFFLNRTNRSGIIDGGVIGGLDQTGAWGIDARYNTSALVERILKVARHASQITLTNHDAAFYIKSVLPTLPPDTFVYLDPPYYDKGEGLYENAYSSEDHRAIAELVSGVPQRWLVSYDAQPAILRLYKGHARLLYDLNYSAASHYRGSEVMYFGPGVRRPKVARPSGILQRLVDLTKQSRPLLTVAR